MKHEENFWRDRTLRVNHAIMDALGSILMQVPRIIDTDFHRIWTNNGFGNLPVETATFQRIATTLFNHFNEKLGLFASFEVIAFRRTLRRTQHTYTRKFVTSSGNNVLIVFEDRLNSLGHATLSTPARRQQILDESRLLWQRNANAETMANTMHQRHSSILSTAVVIDFGDFVHMRFHRVSNLAASLHVVATYPGTFGVSQNAYIGNIFHNTPFVWWG